MKKHLQNLTLSFFCMIGVTAAYAQDTNTDNHTVTITIPEVALLDLETAVSKNFGMSFVAPTEAGSPITAPANNTSIWLNYSSIIQASGDVTRKVSVSANGLVAGVDIQITAAAAASSGAGTKGTPVGTVTLTTADQDLITGVGSCWTGDGAAAGHQLTYALSLTSAGTYGSLVNSSTGVIVTYTLSDN